MHVSNLRSLVFWVQVTLYIYYITLLVTITIILYLFMFDRLSSFKAHELFFWPRWIHRQKDNTQTVTDDGDQRIDTRRIDIRN